MKILRGLIDKYKGNIEYALRAYNGSHYTNKYSKMVLNIKIPIEKADILFVLNEYNLNEDDNGYEKNIKFADKENNVSRNGDANCDYDVLGRLQNVGYERREIYEYEPKQRSRHNKIVYGRIQIFDLNKLQYGDEIHRGKRVST